MVSMHTSLPISSCAPIPSSLTVYHIQRNAPIRGKLLEQHGCTVLEEQVALDGGSLQTVLYLHIKREGPVGRWPPGNRAVSAE